MVWDPPTRLVLSWQLSSEWAYDADVWTELEITFSPEGPDRTRVELEHRGLDAYGDRIEKMRDGVPGRPAGHLSGMRIRVSNFGCARIDAGEAWCVRARATAWRGDLWDR